MTAHFYRHIPSGEAAVLHAAERTRRRQAANMLHARAVLSALGITADQDFHTLTRWQVAELIAEADRCRYRAPKGANGSRGRYFYARLTRRAREGDGRRGPRFKGEA